MKNVFSFDLEFLKNHQSTQAYCYVCVDADGVLNDDVLPKIRHMILETYSDLSHLKIYRDGNHFVDYNGTIKQKENTIELGIFKGYDVDELLVRDIKENIIDEDVIVDDYEDEETRGDDE